MRNVCMVAFLILAGTSVSAQNDKGNQPKTSIVQVSSGCPVGFGANLSGRAVVRSADDAKREGAAQLLELSFFVPLDTPSLKKVEITVHGLPQKGRLLPVQPSPVEDASQAFQLQASADPTSLNRAAVWITQITAARWVEITNIEYADGSSWHASETSLCHSKLSGFKLVDATVQQR
ncbi:hypothetical protein HDF16_006045 [Granulicella aggregans]|uniref:Uncharacterized protein n=1 Tax=Granulicella aggregans TaxID=474949 RepID=A0A7W8E7E0_9BACT|nr:hypothetical protein [Granulicella aggregans]MBB5061309.1 hypothetical protein [Granulicella aggregans]